MFPPGTRVTRTDYASAQSVSVTRPCEDGGVCEPSPKGFGTNRRSRGSEGFARAVFQVSSVTRVCEKLYNKQETET